MLLKSDKLTFYIYHLQDIFNNYLPTKVPTVELAKLTTSKFKSGAFNVADDINIFCLCEKSVVIYL